MVFYKFLSMYLFDKPRAEAKIEMKAGVVALEIAEVRVGMLLPLVWAPPASSSLLVKEKRLQQAYGLAI